MILLVSGFSSSKCCDTATLLHSFGISGSFKEEFGTSAILSSLSFKNKPKERRSIFDVSAMHKEERLLSLVEHE
jgi:hypothetical protein